MGKRSSATISTAQDKGTILIVDDMPENLKMLDNLLSAEGYNVRPSTSGILALNSVKHHLPDLVLLDINMPEMDGYEVCKQLKSDNMTVDIPVVFLSSADDINRRIKGLELGAVDYITKPFNTREILLRINTQLQFQESRKKLKKQNLYLEKMANLQQRRTQMICHDMKGLLTSILSFPKKIKELSSMNHRQDKLLTQIEKSGSKLLQMINRWNELAKLENGTYLFNPKPVDIIPLIDTIIFELQTSIEEKRVYFNTSLNKKPVDKEDTFHILGEELLSYSMLFNLIKNAIEASLPGQTVGISLTRADRQTIAIHNELPVPEDIRSNFFDKFITSGKPGGAGLGTYSAKLSAEALGGTIYLETSEESGTTIIISFPRY